MYSRQLSDTIVQLKLFELKSSDMVASATDTTSNDDLLELLSARSAEDQVKWKVQMVHKIYAGEWTSSLLICSHSHVIGWFVSFCRCSDMVAAT